MKRGKRIRKRRRKRGKNSLSGSSKATTSGEDDSSVQGITEKETKSKKKDSVEGLSQTPMPIVTPITVNPMKSLLGFRQTFSGAAGQELLPFLSNFNRYFIFLPNKPDDTNLGHLLAFTLRGEAANSISDIIGYTAMVARLKESFVATTGALVQTLTRMKMNKDKTIASWTLRYRHNTTSAKHLGTHLLHKMSWNCG